MNDDTGKKKYRVKANDAEHAVEIVKKITSDAKPDVEIDVSKESWTDATVMSKLKAKGIDFGGHLEFEVKKVPYGHGYLNGKKYTDYEQKTANGKKITIRVFK